MLQTFYILLIFRGTFGGGGGGCKSGFKTCVPQVTRQVTTCFKTCGMNPWVCQEGFNAKNGAKMCSKNVKKTNGLVAL